MDIQPVKNLTKFMSLIGLVLSCFLFIPVAVGLVYGEDVFSLALFVAAFFLINLLFYIVLKNHSIQMGIKESIFAVNLIWILLGIAGGAGLYINSDISMADAFFEAVSGFTTTGATIYSDIESLPKNVLILRSLTHWLGGMGIIVLGVGLLTLINPTGSLTLFRSESTGIKLEKLTPKIKDTAFNLWKIYMFFTLVNILLLYAGGMGLFDAVNHAFSTVSTGGFSTKNNSLGYWENNWFILWITTVFMVLNAVNFIAHLRALKGDFKGYFSEEVKWFLGIFVLLSVILTVVHVIEGKDSFFHSMTHSFFTIASIITTTGFASTDYSQWSSLAVALIFVPMFIGGNGGSTAGGIKVIRYVIMIKNLVVQIKQLLHPSAVLGVYIDGRKITNSIINSVAGFFFIYVITVLALTLYLFACDYDFLTSFSAAVACIGNIGPGFGHVGPADNFSIFTDFQKLVLAVFMIIGRLEFYTFFILLSKEFWKKF